MALMIKPDIKFYDTSSLLLAGENLFEKKEKFLISSVTLQELEQIKTSSYKDLDTKYSARIITRLIEQYPELCEVVIHRENYIQELLKYHEIEINNDTKILSDAYWADSHQPYASRVIFVTNDLCLKNIANLYFSDTDIESIEEDTDDYSGYKEIYTNDNTLAQFYQNPNHNHYDLKIGQYLILRDESGEVVDVRVWTGDEHRYLKYGNFDSIWFGKIKPYEKDIYQKLLFDSLTNNKITLIKGPPGSGKTLISLGYLMSQLEANELDKIIVFCNTVATANSAKLGFYPGTRNEKLLDSQIGNLLSSKFGGRDAVERLIEEEKLILLPMSDIRGYDTTGMRAGIYISEAQNLDRMLIKLALQRVGEDCICIIDGDAKTQVDDIHFAGSNNGMRRVSKVYRGHDIYGEVELRNVYRSRIAKIADGI